MLFPCLDILHTGCSKGPCRPHPAGRPVCAPQARSLQPGCLTGRGLPGRSGLRARDPWGQTWGGGPFLEGRGPGTCGEGQCPSPGQLWAGALTQSLLQFMASRGNAIARATFESKVPAFYYRPSASDCP